jgi:hypothetical protein
VALAWDLGSSRPPAGHWQQLGLRRCHCGVQVGAEQCTNLAAPSRQPEPHSEARKGACNGRRQRAVGENDTPLKRVDATT